MKRVKKNPDGDLGTQSDPDNGSNYDNVLRDPVAQYGFEFNSMRMMGLAVVTLMLVSVLFSVSVVLRDPPDDGVWEANEAKSFEVKSRKGTCFLKPVFFLIWKLWFIYFISPYESVCAVFSNTINFSIMNDLHFD